VRARNWGYGMNSIPKITNATPEQAAQIFSRNYIAIGFKLEGIHQYSHENGNPIYWRLRLKNSQTGEKKIWPMHIQNDGNYALTEPEFPSVIKPIYRQNDIKNNPHEPVWITEGELCADALSKMGLIATTSGSWNSAVNADWTILAGRDVKIWRDANEVGLKYAVQVTDILLKLECSVKWIDIKKLNPPDGGDCVDWLSEHPSASKEDILQLSLIEPPDFHKNNQSSEIPVNYPRYEVKVDGVFYCKDVNDSTWICSWLIIKALTRDADGINWGRVLKFKDADHVERQWTMPMELLGGNGDELAKELLRLGLRISPGSQVRKLLVEYITNSETSERARCVLRTGWHEQCFVLPNKVFGSSNEIVLLQSDSHISTDYCSSGDLLDWQMNIAAMCAGNSRLTFSVSLAFAAPLLKLVRGESGGFHLRGESSTGKTTALLVAASVWGGKSYVQNWRATDNGLEGLAAQHNDTLLILDELSQIDPRYAGEVAYMLANGQGKARASKSGSARQRLNWQLLFLSSGEISLASHMLEAGKKAKAGQEVRMIDIPADAGCGKGVFDTLHDFLQGAIFSESLKVSCDKFHGIAGDSFLNKLVLADLPSLHTKIQNLQMDFMQQLPLNTHGQVKRVALRFALVAAAGELATAYGVTGWQCGEAIKAVKRCFESWLNTRDGGIGSHENEVTLDQVRHFFQENSARFDVFDDAQKFAHQMIPHRCAGFRKCDGDFYVYPKTFRDEICKGLGSPKDVAKIVEKCGWLLPNNKDKSAYSSVWVPTQGKTIRLYHFSSNVIGESCNATAT
jgi:putative DNA primase/helicase